MDKDLLLHIVEKMESDISRIDAKVDKLLEFKWQIIGGSVVASLVITGVAQFIMFVIKK